MFEKNLFMEIYKTSVGFFYFFFFQEIIEDRRLEKWEKY